MTGTIEKLRPIVTHQLCCEDAEVVPEAEFVDDLGADSLDMIELVMAIEVEFRVEIPDEEVNKIETVRDAIELIDRKLAGNG